AERVVGLLERHRPALPERANGARAALEAVHPLAERREGDAEHRVLALVPAGADAEVEAAIRELGHRRRPLGEQRRMMEGQRTHEGTEADPARVRCQPCQRRPGVERWALGITGQAGEVVRAEQRLEAAVFRGAGQPAPALPREPFLSLDHQADAHRHRGLRSWRFDSTCARPYRTSGTRSRTHLSRRAWPLTTISRSTPSTAWTRAPSSCRASRRSSGCRWISTAPTCAAACARRR